MIRKLILPGVAGAFMIAAPASAQVSLEKSQITCKEFAGYDTTLGEFILPSDKVRAAADPAATLLEFLTSTYAAAAECGRWDRAALECAIGAPGQVRPLSQSESQIQSR